MSGFGRALGGLLAGYGAGMAADAKFAMERQAKQEDDDALLRRQLALEEKLQDNRLALADVNSSNNIIEKRDELRYRGLLEAADDERDLKKTLAVEERKFGYKLKELGVEFSNSQKLEAFKAQQRIAEYNATTGAQNKIQSTKVGDDGFLYGVRQDGSVAKLSEIKFPKAQGLDALLMGGLNGEDEGGGAAAAPAAPAAAPAPSGQSISASDLAQLYNQATAKKAAGDPRYKNLNASQIKAKVQDMLRAKGFTIPAGA